MDRSTGTGLNTNFCNLSKIGSLSAAPHLPHPIYTISGNSGKRPPYTPEIPESPGGAPSAIAAKIRRCHPCRNLRSLLTADKFPQGAAGGITQNRYAPRDRHLQFPEIAETVCGNCGDLPYNKCAKLRRARYIGRISRWSITCKNTQCFP